MDTSLAIKKIGVDDISVIVQLAKEIWPQTYKEILTADQINYMMELFYTPSSLASQIREKQHQFIVAWFEKKPVAFASYSAVEKTGVFRLHKIYVHPEVQGKGIGRSLIAYILDELKKSAANALELNVNRNNNAKNFYEKLGFQVIGEEDINIGNGYFMNDYVMRKPVR